MAAVAVKAAAARAVEGLEGAVWVCCGCGWRSPVLRPRQCFLSVPRLVLRNALWVSRPSELLCTSQTPTLPPNPPVRSRPDKGPSRSPPPPDPQR